MKSSLDIIVFKRESYDSERLEKDIKAFSDSYKFIVFDANEVKGYFKFFRIPKPFYYWLYPIAFLYDNLMIFSLFLCLCLKYKVSTIHMETYSAGFVGILRRIGLCKKLIYVTTDWFVIDKNKGIWNWLGHYLFRAIDMLAVSSSDTILNLTNQQFHARKTWIINKEILYKQHLELKSIPNGIRSCPVFIGEARKDSGLNLVDNVSHIKYENRQALSWLLKDKLCGINLILGRSCSMNTISSKVIDYLQHGLPVIVTKNIGQVANDIEFFKLGYVVDPNKEDVKTAIRLCYINQKELTENVVNYIQNKSFTNMYEIWKA